MKGQPMKISKFREELSACDWLFDLFATGYDYLLNRVVSADDQLNLTLFEHAEELGRRRIRPRVGSHAARRSARPGVLVASLLSVTALAASFAGWFTASRLPLLVGAEVADPAAAFAHVVVWQGAVVALVLLPMTVALGATFPLALALASAGRTTVGRDVAAVYAANTIGAIRSPVHASVPDQPRARARTG